MKKQFSTAPELRAKLCEPVLAISAMAVMMAALLPHWFIVSGEN